jgi:hypothetical protein
MAIHKTIDPLWKELGWRRSMIYEEFSKVLGRKYHTAELRTVDEARKVLQAAHKLKLGQ